MLPALGHFRVQLLGYSCSSIGFIRAFLSYLRKMALKAKDIFIVAVREGELSLHSKLHMPVSSVEVQQSAASLSPCSRSHASFVQAKRTPFGTFGGKLKALTATDMAVHAAKAAIQSANVGAHSANVTESAYTPLMSLPTIMLQLMLHCRWTRS